MTTAIAIDPGKNGALVAMDDKGPIEIIDIPHHTPFGTKPIVDVCMVRNFLIRHDPDFVVIESVWTMPSDGKASGASLVRSWGCLYGATAGCDVRFVYPSKWKAYAGLIRMVKAASVPRALRFYPSARPLIEGFKNEIDRADAVLIGHFGLFEDRVKRGKR